VQRYIVERFLLAIPTLVVITLLTFIFLRVLLPAKVVDIILGAYGRNDPVMQKNLERELGLSGSLPKQYLQWAGVAWFWGDETGILQGNLGKSLHTDRSVVFELKRRVPVSLELGLWAQISAVAVSVPLGVWSALKQDRWPDYGLRSLAILLNALPGFWIGVLAVTFGSLWFSWAPPIEYKDIFDDPAKHLEIMLAPAILIGLTPGADLLRLVRTQMLGVLREDYIRTAQAKGLSQSTVLYKHALRNALLPVVTIVGVGLPNIIAGTVLFEQIFTIPGMGRYLVDAITRLDYPVIMGLNLLFATLLVLSVILVDITYAVLDPRIKFK